MCFRLVLWQLPFVLIVNSAKWWFAAVAHYKTKASGNLNNELLTKTINFIESKSHVLQNSKPRIVYLLIDYLLP